MKMLAGVTGSLHIPNPVVTSVFVRIARCEHCIPSPRARSPPTAPSWPLLGACCCLFPPLCSIPRPSRAFEEHLCARVLPHWTFHLSEQWTQTKLCHLKASSTLLRTTHPFSNSYLLPHFLSHTQAVLPEILLIHLSKYSNSF